MEGTIMCKDSNKPCLVIDLAAKREEKRNPSAPKREIDLYRCLQQLIQKKLVALKNPKEVVLFISKALKELSGNYVVYVDRELVVLTIQDNEERRDAFRDEEVKCFINEYPTEDVFYIKRILGEITEEQDRLFAGELFTIMLGILRAHSAKDRLS